VSAGFLVVVHDQFEGFGIKDAHMTLLDFHNLVFNEF
jgi:hypothetical protein